MDKRITHAAAKRLARRLSTHEQVAIVTIGPDGYAAQVTERATQRLLYFTTGADHNAD